MSTGDKRLWAFKNLCARADEIVMKADAYQKEAENTALDAEVRASAFEKANVYRALWNFIQETFAKMPEEIRPTAAFILLVGSDEFAKCTPVSAQWQEWSTCKIVERFVDVDQLQKLCAAAPEFADLVSSAHDDSEILGSEPPAGADEIDED